MTYYLAAAAAHAAARKAPPPASLEVDVSDAAGSAEEAFFGKKMG
jgi:hypothetical protein